MSVSPVSKGGNVRQFVELVQGFERDRMCAPIIAHAKLAVIDAIGRTLEGDATSPTHGLSRSSNPTMSDGPSLIIGSDRRCGVLDAVLLNATSAGTQQAALVAAAISLSEPVKATGRDLLDAVALGDLAGIALRSSQTAACATAACGRLLKLDPDRLAVALHLAVVLGDEGRRSDSPQLSRLQVAHQTHAGAIAALTAAEMPDAECQSLLESDALSASFDFDEIVFATRELFRDISQNDPWDQFDQRASRALARDQVAPLFERLETLDKAADIATVTRLLQTRPGNATTAAKVVFAPKGVHEPEETTWVP